jgi:hypothetical protein
MQPTLLALLLEPTHNGQKRKGATQGDPISTTDSGET